MPRLPEVRAAFVTIVDALRAADVWPPGLDSRRAGSLIGWADQQARDIRSLDNWRARLEEYGDDPGE